MKKQRTRLGIGSISTDTTIARDIAESLIWDLKQIRITREDRARVNALSAELANSDTHTDEETSSEILEDLASVAQGYAPDYTIVGMREGDGADFGVWIDWDAMEDGFVFKGERADCPSDRTHCLEVNDHGNSTLFRRAGTRWVEAWAVV